MPTHALTRASRSHGPDVTVHERGFTVVEVIIAVLLMTVVVSAIAFAVTGSTSIRGAARLQAST
ncbi:MAG: prepilin-type N-terminal cleavage/methylation domain-containing protein [Thermoleophilia bacterium]|nr:prepilin-type N-terminal cleavage/methylation domain-containing protein [Thermoleophilia bacterium]